MPNNGDQAPSVSIGAIAPSTGTVTIPVTVFDANTEKVSLTVELQQGTSFVPLALSADLTATPTGTETELQWDAASFFGSSARVTGLAFRVTPHDQYQAGAAVTSQPFVFGNNPPLVTNVSVATDQTNTARGQVSVSFTIIDDSDSESLSSFSISIGGAAATAIDVTNLANFAGDSVDGLASSQTGATSTIVWDTGVSAAFTASDVVLSLAVTDNLGAASTIAISAPFSIDNSPGVSLAMTPPAGARWLDAVPVAFTVNAATGDAVALAFAFSVNGGAFHAASAKTGSSPITNLAPGQHGTFIWDALADAGSGGLTAAPRDRTGDGTASTPTLDYFSNVVLRATPSDTHSAAGTPVAVPTFAIGAEPVVLGLETISGIQSNEVPVAFSLTDAQSDLANVDLEFCLPTDGCDPAAPPFTGGWRNAALGHGSLTALATNAGGAQHVVTWASIAGLDDTAPQNAQGIGKQEVDAINTRARAESHVDGLSTIYGAWSTTTIQEVRNETPPVLSNIYVRRLSLTGGVAPVAIDYTVTDEESDTVDFDCEFSQDGGATFDRCAEYAEPKSEGRYNLASAPSAPGGGGGMAHTFVWDPSGQMAGTAATQLRLFAHDFAGGSSADIFPPQPASPRANFGRWFGNDPGTTEGYDPSQLQATFEGLALADFDGDHVLDAVVAYSDSNIRVFHGVGADGVVDASGGFTPSQGTAYPTGTYQPIKIASGDFNGDGWPDVVIASFDIQAVTVFLNDQTGGLSSTAAGAGDYPTSGYPSAMAVADFNQDGFDDLAVVQQFGGGIGLLVIRGSATGLSEPMQSFAISGTLIDVRVADFNADGITDIAMLSTTQTQIMLGNGAHRVGNGGFNSDNLLTPPAPAGATAFDAADLDGDGAAEIAVTGPSGSALLTNAGDGTFTSLPLAATGGYVRLLDVTGDGARDLLIAPLPPASAVNPGPVIYVGDGAGGLWPPIPAPEWSSNTDFTTYYAQVEAGNFGSDGAPDLVYGIIRTGSGGYSLFRHVYGSWQGGFQASGQSIIDPSDFVFPQSLFTQSADFPPLLTMPQFAVAADIDGDGQRDLITAAGDDVIGVGNAPAKLALWHNEASSGTNGPPSLILHGSRTLSAYARAIVVGDYNGDGYTDLAVAQDDGVQILFGDDNRNFTDGPLLTTTDMFHPVALVAADFNGDGIADLAAASSGASIVSVWLGGGSAGVPDGTFGVGSEVTTGPQVFAGYPQWGYFPRGLAVCDVNSDGFLDLVVSNNNNASFTISGGVSVRFGDGSGAFPSGPDMTIDTDDGDNFHPADVACADLDRDGIPDIVLVGTGVSTSSGNEAYGTVLFGQGAAGVGNGTFAGQADVSVNGGNGGYYPYNISIGDLDQDGILDLAVATTSSGLYLLHGTGTRGSPFDISYAYPTTNDRESVLLADIDGDHFLDALVTYSNAYEGTLGQTPRDTHYFFATHYDRLEPLRRTLSPFSASAGSYSPALAPTLRDRFGVREAAPDLTQMRASEGPSGENDVTGAARLALPAALAGRMPLTDAWRVAGDTRLTRVAEPSGVSPPTGPRLRVESRWGALSAPTSTSDFDHAGLDLSDPSFANQRGVVVDLPIYSSVGDSTITSGSVVVAQATIDWRRADAQPLDPMHGNSAAHRYLPRVPDGAGGYRDVVSPIVKWRVVAPDADGNFATGSQSGARFVVDTSATGGRRVRVLTDSSGYFQAFWQP